MNISEIDYIQRAADAEGKNVSVFVRELILNGLKLEDLESQARVGQAVVVDLASIGVEEKIQLVKLLCRSIRSQRQFEERQRVVGLPSISL